MQEELQTLSAKIRQVIDVVERLRKDNAALQTTVDNLERDRQQLQQKIATANARIDALLERLPSNWPARPAINASLGQPALSLAPPVALAQPPREGAAVLGVRQSGKVVLKTAVGVAAGTAHSPNTESTAQSLVAAVAVSR